MSAGGGQLVVLPLGSAFPNFKMYHYTTGGGTILKNIYSDEDLQTTMAQPAVADVNGVIAFYALGDFRIKIDDEDDVNIYDWDNYHITQGQPLITDYSTALPAAAAANKGHLYAVIDGSNVLRNVAVNQNTSFASIYTANASGVRTDSTGLFSSYPWYDITHPDYGAVAGQASDQYNAINTAVTLIEAAGEGTLFIPEGRFQLDQVLSIDNTSINIVGLGFGRSVLVQTADASGPMIDYDTTDITDTFYINGVTLETSFAGAGSAIDCNWPTASLPSSNCLIENVIIRPTNAASGSAYFTNGIVLTDSPNAKVNNVWINGRDNSESDMTAGLHLVDCPRASIDDLLVFYADKGILLEGNCEEVQIDKPHLNYVDQGILADFTAGVQDKITITGGFIEAFFKGISFISCINSKILGVTIINNTSSSDNFRGITTDSASNTLTILGNSVREIGSGTTIGIEVDGNNCLVEGNFVEDQTSNIVAQTNSNTCYFVNNRAENQVTNNYLDSGTSNKWENNYLEATQTIVAATTITIPPVGSTFLISDGSATTINRITESWPGRKITLYKEYDGAAADNTTITDSVDNLTQSIRLSGATTLDQEHTLSLLCSDDGMWYATSIEDN